MVVEKNLQKYIQNKKNMINYYVKIIRVENK